MTQQDRYAGMSGETFHDIVTNLATRDGMAVVLSIPGVWEEVSEYYNNAALERWEQDHPEDMDAPQVGDLVFDPSTAGIALQGAYGTIESVDGTAGDGYNVVLTNGDTVSVEFYDSAWHLTEKYQENPDERIEGDPV
jgi:hypothetical protein